MLWGYYATHLKLSVRFSSHRSQLMSIILCQNKCFLSSLKVYFNALTVFSCLHRGAFGYEGNRRRAGLADMAFRSGGQTRGEYCSSLSSDSHVSTWNLPEDKSAWRKCSGRAPLRASAAETVDRLTCVVGCVYSVHVRFL